MKWSIQWQIVNVSPSLASLSLPNNPQRQDNISKVCSNSWDPNQSVTVEKGRGTHLVEEMRWISYGNNASFSLSSPASGPKPCLGETMWYVNFLTVLHPSLCYVQGLHFALLPEQRHKFYRRLRHLLHPGLYVLRAKPAHFRSGWIWLVLSLLLFILFF